MGARENLQRLADRKAQEIGDLERQIDMAKAYLQAIQDSIKALPREVSSSANGLEGPSSILRAGTLLARAKDAIQRNGSPMHINALLAAIGMENKKSARVSLVGSLGGSVRKRQVFTRPGPNIFGLIGMPSSHLPVEIGNEPDFPESFGTISGGV
jgi:hypothetical protein